MASSDNSNRIEKLWSLTRKLYSQTTRPEAKYLWNNHVQVVAKYASELSDRYGGDKEKATAGALLHDIADIRLERDDKEFEKRSRKTTEDLLTSAGFSDEEIIFINDQVIAPHSCYPQNRPTVIEGKIVAAADAMAHLTTNFYRAVYS